jgi:hypothetical protein
MLLVGNGLGGFWGLTCDFWAKNAKNNFIEKQKQWNQ